MAEVMLAVDCRNHHGEGVFWNPAESRVWWTDIEGCRLWWHEPETGAAGSIEMPGRVCCFAPRRAGGFICAFADRIALIDAEGRILSTLAIFEPDNPDTRLNDGRTDRQGRLIAGGMNEGSGAADSGVLRVDPDGSVTRLIEGVACANSTCFSPDGRTLYFADTPDRKIRAYDYDPGTGTLGAMRIHANLAAEPGLPDGSCVDADGGVWNAEWEGGRVIRIASDGAEADLLRLRWRGA
jgi:L-arabinonolactonase